MMAKPEEETVKVICLQDISVGKKSHEKHAKITIKKRLYDCHKHCFEVLIDDSEKDDSEAPKKDSAQAVLLSKAAK